MVPAAIAQALDCLEPLRAGKTTACETSRVAPVPIESVYCVEMLAGRVLAVMIEVQRLTEMRPSNLCAMRPRNIDRSTRPWVYRPTSHKSAWRGRPLEIFLGPRAEQLLRPFLDRPVDAYLFDPRESSTGPRKGRRPVGMRYNRTSYARAIRRLCVKAGIEPWHPYQLRHAAGTRIRAGYGLEASQVTLGHARADVTQIYAERDRELAKRIAREAG